MCRLTVGTDVIHSLDLKRYDTSTRGTAQQRPIPVKRPAHLTWSKVAGRPIESLLTACSHIAHLQPANPRPVTPYPN